MDILQSDGRTEVIHNYFTAFTVIWYRYSQKQERKLEEEKIKPEPDFLFQI